MIAPSQSWFRVALRVGIVYLIVGRLFAMPASHVQAWRLAAWVVSGLAFAAHVLYEQFSRRSSPLPLGLHAGVGVALGGVFLAIAGMIHSLSATSHIGSSWLLALVLFPATTAVPAFLAAALAGAGLTRLARNAGHK